MDFINGDFSLYQKEEQELKTLFFLLIFSVFYIFWIPGPRVSTDFHFTTRMVQQSNIYPYAWREAGVANGLGEYNVPSLWSQPLHSIFGLLSNFLNFSEQTKILGFIILIIGYISIWKLLGLWQISTFGKVAGSLLFLLNSYFLLIFDGGQLSICLSYALFPLAVADFFKLTESNFWKDKLNLIITILIISVFDLRMIYLLMIIFFVLTFYQLSYKSTSKWFKDLKNLLLTFSLLLVILIGSHAYWLLPALLAKSINLPQTYGRVSQIDFLSFSTLAHGLFLQQPHWYQNIFGKVDQLRVEFIFIPILVFITPLLVKKDKGVGFWLLIALMGIFLVKGSNPPLPQIYGWLFANLPGFSLFRDPSKFYFLISLSYSVLISYSVTALSKRSLKLVILVIIYLIWLAKPVFLGQMTGLLSQPMYKTEYSLLANRLEKDENFGRILWVPTKPPLTFENLSHPGINAIDLTQKRPFTVSSKGTYETLNYLREAPYIGQLFDVAGIKYIVIPFLDLKRNDLDPDKIKYYYTFLNQLTKLNWIKTTDFSVIPLLETIHHQQKFFVSDNLWWVIGSDSIYQDSTRSADLALSKNALVFVEEIPYLGKMIDNYPEAKVILNNKTETDLAASLINSQNLFFPAQDLGFSPDESGWWKREATDLISWRDFLQNKYGINNQDFDLGGGWAVAEGDLELKIKNDKLRKNQLLLARVLESTKSGQIKFYQGQQLIGQINTTQSKDNIRWFEVGKLSADNVLQIKTEGQINVLNALAVVDNREWQMYQDKADNFKSSGRIRIFGETGERNLATVNFKQIDPTKYEINIDKLDKPTFIVFGQNYDKEWQINGQSALPVYSLLNGFRIDKNGKYIVYFRPQRYIGIGLKVSLASIILLSGFLILTRVKRQPKL